MMKIKLRNCAYVICPRCAELLVTDGVVSYKTRLVHKSKRAKCSERKTVFLVDSEKLNKLGGEIEALIDV